MPGPDLERVWGIRNKLPLDRGSDKEFVAIFNELQMFTEERLLKRFDAEVDGSLYSLPGRKVPQLAKLYKTRGGGWYLAFLIFP